jgi:UDP-N-acetylmuramoyl-L-alanyl-D-glutamate--2,6-diaminopimelate ligase
MNQLKDILFGVRLEAIQGNTNVSISSVAFDSRKAQEGGLFVAIKGEVVDGHDYIEKAIALGSIAIVCEKKPTQASEKVVWITTANSREALAIMAANFYDRPSAKLKLIGVTGTNGKTTVTTLLHRLFTKAGYAAGLISTIAIKYNLEEIPATHTTPDPLEINSYLNAMVEAGVDYCFMEVSSHGIDQDRIKGLIFAGGVFTNLSHDHLDYHKTFADYRNVKKQFFDHLPKTAFALTNADDKNGAYMLQNSEAKQKSFGLQNFADYQAKVLETQFSGMLLKINQQEVWTTLVGKFNASNLIAAFAVAQELGIDAIEAPCNRLAN